MKSFISLLFASSILLTSCKNDAETKNSTSPTNVVPFTVVGNQMKSESQATPEQQTGTNNATTTAPIAAPQNNAGSTTIADGMNPAHGQPGHRCDIPVGAPLPTN